MAKNPWLKMVEANPEHSNWYIQRFNDLAAEGKDLVGEARFIDAMVQRNSVIVDAGCGFGRVGGHLSSLGHRVIGVDIDAALIAEAEKRFPNAHWIAEDLVTVNIDTEATYGSSSGADAIVCSGNVVTFMDPETRVDAYRNMAKSLAETGRLVVGFGAGRNYGFDEFLAEAAEAGFEQHVLLSSWHIEPFNDESDFLVAVLKLSGAHSAT